MLADGYLTASVLSLVLPLALLALVLGAWWLAVHRGGLDESAAQQREGGGGSERHGA